MKIGSHVKMASPNYVLGSVKEMLSYDATAFMLYSGAPQNTKRTAISKLKIEEAHALMEKHNIDKKNMIMHAPYIINLANTIKEATYEIAVSFLKEEIARCEAFGCTTLVLHPGSHVGAGEDVGLDSIVKGLDEAMVDIQNVNIALETMAGKGTELGYRFEHLKYIKDHVTKKDHIKVCMDTCHMHDAGYDIHDIDALLDKFDEIIGLENLVCIHVNDSKNAVGARKDRHENIGHGEIGFDTLSNYIHHPKLADVVKILETPYVGGHAPYKEEIHMLLENTYDEHILDKYR